MLIPFLTSQIIGICLPASREPIGHHDLEETLSNSQMNKSILEADNFDDINKLIELEKIAENIQAATESEVSGRTKSCSYDRRKSFLTNLVQDLN